MRGRLGFILVIVVALIGLVPQYLSRTLPDIAFPLWAAGRVLDGATLYVDILEINPPLFIWLDIPIVALARLTGLDPILVYRLAVTAVLVASTTVAARMVSSRVMQVAIVFALFVLPRLDWGEREHLALALMLPWLALAVRRLEGSDVPQGMALVTGLAAGVGIALKPHFAVVWMGRELAMWLGSKGGQGGRLAISRLWRADSVAPVLVCIAYLLAAFVFTPEYFPLVRELAGPYSRFIRATVLETMLGPAPAVALAALVVAVGLRKVGAPGPLETILFWSTVAWSVVALLQLKGFRYHWYPAMALGLLLLAQLARVARGVHISFTSRLFRAVATATVVTTVVVTTWGAVRQAATPLAPEWDADPSIGLLLEALEGRVEPGDTLAVLTPNMASGFPLTNYLGTVWPLRLSNVWPAIVAYEPALELGESPSLRPLADALPPERWSVNVVAEDMGRIRPEWMLGLRHLPGRAAPYMSKLNLAAYLQRDSRLAALWAGYDSLGTIGMYSVWHRRGRGTQLPIGAVQWRRNSDARPSGPIAVADSVAGVGALLVLIMALDLILSRTFAVRGSG